jgi:hypothetical protein
MFTRLWRLNVLRPALALALVAGFLGTPFGIAHAGRLAHDPCDAQQAPLDPAAPRLAPADARHAHGHCFTCHWFQSLRTALVSCGVDVPQAVPAGLLHPDAPLFAAAFANPIAGARAPPV